MDSYHGHRSRDDIHLPSDLPSNILGRRHKPGFFVEYLLLFRGKGRRKPLKVWVDVALMVDHFLQESETTAGKLSIVEMVELFDSKIDTDLSVLHVIDEKMEPGLPAPLYKVMWKDYPNAFCNWEVRENMGRDVGKLDEYLKRKEQLGDGMVENPISAEFRLPNQVPEIVDDSGNVLASDGHEKEDEMQEEQQQQQQQEEEEEEVDAEGVEVEEVEADTAQCEHCHQLFRARGLTRHISVAHPEEWRRSKENDSNGTKRKGSRLSVAATSQARGKRSRHSLGQNASPVQPQSKSQRNEDGDEESNRQRRSSVPSRVENVEAAAAIEFADALVMVSSIKDWRLFCSDLQRLVDRVDTALMEKYWQSLVERADYPGKSQKVDVGLMINWCKVRLEKLKTYILQRKWGKACVLAMIACHLLSPLCADMRNFPDPIKTEIRKMVKRLEKSFVKETAEHPALFNFLNSKIEAMKKS